MTDDQSAADQKDMTDDEIVEGLAEALFDDAMDSVDRVLRWKDGGAANPEALRRAARVAISFLAAESRPAADRIANAPRAWAHESKDGRLFRVTHDKEAADELSRRLGGKTFLAAIVELTEEEAGK